MSDPILSVFEKTGAYLRGHFRLTSGLHSPEYLQCAKVLQYPMHAFDFGVALGREFGKLAEGRKIDIVASPAIGGLIIGHEVARALGARFIFTERDATGKMTLRRGFEVAPGETAVVVEDVVTTGGSSREVIEILQDLKAKVIVVFLFAVFPVLINTYQGVRECDKNMIEVARSFRSSERHMWRDVLLPFALPYIAAGVRLAIGRGLVGMVIAEFYTTISGLGFMITRYANVFEMDKTLVPVFVLMALGVTLTSGLKRLERRIAPWSHGNR